MEQVYENKEICAACGGRCCKKCGCDYAATDFIDLGINNLFNILMEGRISIVSAFSLERLHNGKIFLNPILFLRARNIDRPIVDLLSLKKTCSQLSDNGCSYTYENRPAGGRNLIPGADDTCYPAISQLDIIRTWQSYQRPLSKLVKKITGNTVDEQIKIDVENLFIDVLNQNFDGVSELEIVDIQTLLPHLVEAFPNEYENALNKTGKKIKIKNKLNI